jgi:hypothetical protein
MKVIACIYVSATGPTGHTVSWGGNELPATGMIGLTATPGDIVFAAFQGQQLLILSIPALISGSGETSMMTPQVLWVDEDFPFLETEHFSPSKAVVISLITRADRLARFQTRWSEVSSIKPLIEHAVRDDNNPASGCLRSHMKVWSQFTEPVLILEDDACFSKDFTLELNPPADWDILWLGCQHVLPPISLSNTWALPTCIVCTHGYIVRDPQLLLSTWLKFGYSHLDPYIGVLPLNQYTLCWPTIGQSAEISDITAGRIRTKPNFFPHWINQLGDE